MKKPNIVFILMDDLGWSDVGCNGSSFYETPNIDRLAARGMRFTDAYAACPVCSPTRASILSGKYPARVGVTNWIGGHNCGKLLDVPYTDHLPLEESSLAAALREGGYATWHVGKWHLGGEPYHPERHGFDVNVGGCHMGCPAHGYFSPWKIPVLDDSAVPEGTYLPHYLTDQAVDLIRGRRGSDQPFFLNFWFYLVHTPIEAPEPLVEKYRRKAAALNLDKQQVLIEGERLPCQQKKDIRVVRRVLQSDPVYAAMVEVMDESIGRVLKTLEEEGLAEDTIIIFTSDNGGVSTAEGSPTCNAPLAEGKGWMYEGGVREPLIVHWPGVTNAGSLCREPVTSTDFYPTLLEMAGLPARPDQHCDGVSIAPLLKGTDRLHREAVFWHYPHYSNQGNTPGCSVRSGDWKLLEFFEDGRVELYNLREDTGEDHNVAGEHPEIVQRLLELLHDWQRDVEARIPQPNPECEPWPHRVSRTDPIPG